MKIAAFASLLLHAAAMWLAPAVREGIIKHEGKPAAVFYIGEFQEVSPRALEKPEAEDAPLYSHFIIPETGAALMEPPAFHPGKVRESPPPDAAAIEETGFAEIPLKLTGLPGIALPAYETPTIPFEERIEP